MSILVLIITQSDLGFHQFDEILDGTSEDYEKSWV